MTERRPRLLILTVGFGVGGAEQLVLMTAPRLADAGFEVLVASLKGRGPIASEIEAAGVRCVALGGRGRADLPVFGRLYRLLRAHRPDILHAHLFPANLAARLAGRAAGVPIVIAAHHDTQVWSRPHHRLLERLTARLSDRIVACSEAVRAHVLASYGLPEERVVTLRNAIVVPQPADDPESRRRQRARLGAGPGDLLVGTLGRLEEPKKGLACFLRAAAIVAGREPRARFALVGEGPARRPLQRQAEATGLAGRITFAGERRDVAELLPAVDVFVQPSLWEGFGLTILEAMAASRPVVASRVGGVPEIVRDGVDGILVPSGDAGALAEALVGLLRDPRRAARMGRSGRERVETSFGIDGLVRATAALYRDLLRARGVAPAAAPAAPPGRAA
jgi:glycosyltransferase involved in cell wall biosynthesis